MRRSRTALALAAFGMATALVGCANPAPPTDSTTETATTLSMATNGIPDGLTTSKWDGTASHFVLSGLGSQLIAYDLGPTFDEACNKPTFDKVKGRLAESIDVNDDGTAVVIKLKDLTSQWGNKLSAEDVKWSFETGMVRDSGVFAGGLKKQGFDTENLVTIIDDKTVQLNLLERNSFSVSGLSHIQYVIYDSTEAKKHATAADPTADNWLRENLADYSGWKLTSFTPGSSLALEADPNWGGQRGNITSLVANAVPDTSTRAELITRGESQFGNGFNYSQYASFADNPNLKLEDCRSITRDTMMLNTTSETLKDKRVRQAISMAIDREGLVKGAYAGFADASVSAFPGLKAAKTYKHDPAAAKKLLADAGYPDGLTVTISYGTSRPGPVAEQSAILIKSQLAEVGIQAELNVVASGTELNTVLHEGRYEILLYAEPIVNSDPAFYADPFYVCEGTSNATGWCEPEYDGLLAEFKRTPPEDEKKRQAIFEEMGAIVADGAANLALVVVHNVNVSVKELTGGIMSTNSQVYFNDLSR